MTDYIRLDYWDLGLAALLLVAVAAISLLLQLKIERRLLWAGLAAPCSWPWSAWC